MQLEGGGRWWNRGPRIRNGACHFFAEKFRYVLMNEITPWAELRRQVEDAVPSTGDERQRDARIDLLRSLCLVVYALFARLDLKSLRVGYTAGKGRRNFVGIPLRILAEWTGLGESTVSHTLTILRRAGLVFGPGDDGVNVIKQPCEEIAPGVWKFKPAIRRVDIRLFLGLGADVAAMLRAVRTRPPLPSPADGPAVSPGSTRTMVGTLAHALALERPPDG